MRLLLALAAVFVAGPAFAQVEVFAEPASSAAVCRCGPDCDCEDCQCDADCAVIQKLYFWAEWCGPCKNSFVPAGVEKVDFDKEQERAKALGIEKLPTYLVVRNGKVLKKREGALGREDAEAFCATWQADPYVKVLAGDARGSGVVVRKDGNSYAVLTNAHVVRAGWPHRVLVRGEEVEATCSKTTTLLDLALLEFDLADDIEVVRLAKQAPADGVTAATYGFPQGGERRDRTVRLRTKWAKDLYATNQPFLQGESGGALVVNGELVGLVTGTDRAQGLCVDLPSVRSFLEL